jgi:hypothetical protein
MLRRKLSPGIFRQKVGKEAQGNTELQIEYEKILERVKQTRDSVIRMENRRFTAPVEEVEGTVESVSPAGITLKEFPGRRFQFSSVGMSAADMSARAFWVNRTTTQVSSSCRKQNLAGGRAEGTARMRKLLISGVTPARELTFYVQRRFQTPELEPTS